MVRIGKDGSSSQVGVSEISQPSGSQSPSRAADASRVFGPSKSSVFRRVDSELARYRQLPAAEKSDKTLDPALAGSIGVAACANKALGIKGENSLTYKDIDQLAYHKSGTPFAPALITDILASLDIQTTCMNHLAQSEACGLLSDGHVLLARIGGEKSWKVICGYEYKLDSKELVLKIFDGTKSPGFNVEDVLWTDFVNDEWGDVRTGLGMRTGYQRYVIVIAGSNGPVPLPENRPAPFERAEAVAGELRSRAERLKSGGYEQILAIPLVTLALPAASGMFGLSLPFIGDPPDDGEDATSVFAQERTVADGNKRPTTDPKLGLQKPRDSGGFKA